MRDDRICSDDMKAYHYWLCQTKGFGAVKVGQLISFFGSPKDVYEASIPELTGAMEEMKKICRDQEIFCPFGPADIGRLIKHQEEFQKYQAQYQSLKKMGIRYIVPNDPEYPPSFYSLYDMPQQLFLRGAMPDFEAPCLSIVGSRRCTAYGSEVAYALADQLTARGVNIISGMAEGVDGAAHRGAIDRIHSMYNCGREAQAGRTLAFLGGGVDRCYPLKNMDIYQELSRTCESKGEGSLEHAVSGSVSESGEPWSASEQVICGGVISEYQVGSSPYPGNFPMRNRLISAMSDILIVVEARMKSGSLITADQALEQGKEVFVVPGRVTDPLSEGCNRLIAQGAGILYSLEEFVDEHFPEPAKRGKKEGFSKIQLAIQEEMVYSCVDFIPKHIDQILAETGLKLEEALVSLMGLRAAGLVTETAKNYYACKLRQGEDV